MSVWVIETKGNVERDIGIYSRIIFHAVSNRKLFNETTDLYIYIYILNRTVILLETTLYFLTIVEIKYSKFFSI